MQRPATKRKDAKPSRRPRPGAAQLYRPDIMAKYGPTPATVAATTRRYLAGGPAVEPVQPTMRRKTSKRRAA